MLDITAYGGPIQNPAIPQEGIILCGIYLIKDAVDGAVYVGKARDIVSRWRAHLRDLRANKHGNHHLQSRFNAGRTLSVQVHFLTIRELSAHELGAYLNLKSKGTILLNVAQIYEHSTRERRSEQFHFATNKQNDTRVTAAGHWRAKTKVPRVKKPPSRRGGTFVQAKGPLPPLPPHLAPK